MKPTILIIALLAASGVGTGFTRASLPGQASLIPQTRPSSEPFAKTVRYKGIMFSFNSSLASAVIPETVSRRSEAGGLTADTFPEHQAFSFVGFRRPSRLSPDSREMRVFPVPEFVKINRFIAVEVKTLQAIVREKASMANLNYVIARARHDKADTRMPFIPIFAAGQAFVAHLRYVDFKNGKGVFFLTQWLTETEQIDNEGLEYAYQGITDDGKYYVCAEFPVVASFLPNGNEPDVMAWNEKNYLIGSKSAKYQAYVRPVVQKLEALPAKEFHPNLELLEQLIQSLEVKSK